MRGRPASGLNSCAMETGLREQKSRVVRTGCLSLSPSLTDHPRDCPAGPDEGYGKDRREVCVFIHRSGKSSQ